MYIRWCFVGYWLKLVLDCICHLIKQIHKHDDTCKLRWAIGPSLLLSNCLVKAENPFLLCQYNWCQQDSMINQLKVFFKQAEVASILFREAHPIVTSQTLHNKLDGGNFHLMMFIA